MIRLFKRILVITGIYFAATTPVLAQNIFTAGVKANLPTVRFSFENPSLKPSNYELTVDVTGEADYFSREEQDSPGGERRRVFQVSKANRDRIFILTEVLRKFQGDYEFKKHRVAFTGKKTFTYIEGPEEHSTEFNWSENKHITELAALFQGIASTIQSEARLNYLRKYDKLGLSAELAILEQKANSGWLIEIGVISNVLREIAEDRGIMGMARARARRLLKIADRK